MLQTSRKNSPQNNFTHMVKWSTIYLNHVKCKIKTIFGRRHGGGDYVCFYTFPYFSNTLTVSTYFLYKKLKTFKNYWIITIRRVLDIQFLGIAWGFEFPKSSENFSLLFLLLLSTDSCLGLVFLCSILLLIKHKSDLSWHHQR